jgi:uncharacterized protein
MIVSQKKIDAAALQSVPWKNGGGVTREVASQRAAVEHVSAEFDTFDWRVSLAEVASPGPFSVFPGIDRVLVMTHGEQMVLEDPHRTHALERWQPFVFAGEVSITAHLPAGPTRDFNLMVRREYGRGQVQVHRAGPLTLGTGCAVLHCASGGFSLTIAGDDDGPATIELVEGDTLLLEIEGHAGISVLPLADNAALIDARVIAIDRAADVAAHVVASRE